MLRFSLSRGVGYPTRHGFDAFCEGESDPKVISNCFSQTADPRGRGPDRDHCYPRAMESGRRNSSVTDAAEIRAGRYVVTEGILEVVVIGTPVEPIPPECEASLAAYKLDQVHEMTRR